MGKGFADSVVVAVKLLAEDGHGNMTRGENWQKTSRMMEAKG